MGAKYEKNRKQLPSSLRICIRYGWAAGCSMIDALLCKYRNGAKATMTSPSRMKRCYSNREINGQKEVTLLANTFEIVPAAPAMALAPVRKRFETFKTCPGKSVWPMQTCQKIVNTCVFAAQKMTKWDT